MNSNRIILVSLGVPVLAFFLLWLAYKFYSPDPSGPRSVVSTEHRVHADDGQRLVVRVSGPAKPAGASGRLLFMHADRGLNRDWNSRSADFRTGARLNRILASHGLQVISYDQRDLGAAGPGFANIDDLAADLRVVVRWYLKRYAAKTPGQKYSILGHGQGCLAALRSVTRGKLAPREIFLVNCVYTGSLLESWGDRILHNMRNAHVAPGNLARARAEFEAWVKARPFAAKVKPAASAPGKKSKEKQEHPDILGFRRALEFLESPKMRDWSRQAADLYFESELRTVLARPGIRVTYWISRHDAEFPPERVAEAEKTAARLSKSTGRFRFEVLPDANHFLKVQSGPSRGALSTTWNRATPFARLSPIVIKTILAEQ